MESPLIPDSSLESQNEPKKAKKTEYNSSYSTDDELNLELSPQTDLSSSYDSKIQSLKLTQINLNQEQKQKDINSQFQLPRTILGFLEKKIELKSSSRNQNKNTSPNQIVITEKKNNTQQEIKSVFSFRVKSYRLELEDSHENDQPNQKNSNIQKNQKKSIEKNEQKKYIVYEIEGVEQKEPWTFSSRYSMLRDLYKSLKKEIANYSALKLPKFPRKKLFGNLDEQFLSKRSKQLDLFLSSMSKNEFVMNSNTIQELISESREVADDEFSL